MFVKIAISTGAPYHLNWCLSDSDNNIVTIFGDGVLVYIRLTEFLSKYVYIIIHYLPF